MVFGAERYDHPATTAILVRHLERYIRVTIIQAIKTVMAERKSPMTTTEVYEAIVAGGLYEFHAANPVHIVQQQIRRHCEGIDFPTSSATKHFRLVEQNRYLPLEMPKRIRQSAPHRRARRAQKAVVYPAKRSLPAALRALQDFHAEYTRLLRDRLALELRHLSPGNFEYFARALLDVYGFENTHVTGVGRDGGVDGYGKLRVGLAHLNVAFQCKRWRKGNIQRTEIDKFRGATQGDFEQGIFFATSSFSRGAIDASIKRGAIPIVLVDLAAIIDLMLEKRFGVQVENLVVPTYALDVALTPSPAGSEP